MEFSLNIKVNPKDNPDQVGEILRKRFFAKEYGCYDCFDWAKDVEELPDEFVEDDFDVEEQYRQLYKCGRVKIAQPLEMRFEVIKCRWYWDGDGELQFIFSDGSMLRNDDCKKDYNWQYLTADEFKRQVGLE